MEYDKLFGFMEKMYSEMQNGFKDLKDDVSVLKTGQLKLENKLEDTRKTLFDGYIQNTESIKRLESKVDDMQMDINTLSAKTYKNENRIIEFSKHLKDIEIK